MSPEIVELKLLADQLAGVADRLEKITGYGRRTRRLAVAGIVLFVVDVALSVFMVVLAVDANHQAKATKQANITACNSANQLRGEEKALWEGIITASLAQGPPPGESQQKLDYNAKLLNNLVLKAFPLRDCRALYH